MQRVTSIVCHILHSSTERIFFIFQIQSRRKNQDLTSIEQFILQVTIITTKNKNKVIQYYVCSSVRDVLYNRTSKHPIRRQHLKSVFPLSGMVIKQYMLNIIIVKQSAERTN